MCSAPSMPSIPEPEPLPPPKPLPAPQQPKPAPTVAPPAPLPATPSAPLPKQVQAKPTAPPPTLVTGADDVQPVVKQKKTKRQQVQQRSKGTSALSIPLNTGSEPAAGKGGTGLNIPTK